MAKCMKVLIVFYLKSLDKMKFLLIFILLGTTISTFSQVNDSLKINKNIKFANYLIGTGQFSDAIYLLNQIDFNDSFVSNYKDTLNYLKGWAFYNIKSLDSANTYFLRTTPNTFVSTKSRFFAAYNSIYQRREEQGKEILKGMILTDPQWMELRY